MDLIVQQLLIFSQIEEGKTLSNYLGDPALVTVVNATGLVNTFRSLYSNESPQQAWDYIQNTFNGAIVHYQKNPVTTELVQLLHRAIVGISTLTSTYSSHYLLVGNIRLTTARWSRMVDQLISNPPNYSHLSFSLSDHPATLTDSYSAVLPSHTSTFKVEESWIIGSSKGEEGKSLTQTFDSIPSLQKLKLIPHPALTPTLDDLNTTVNTILPVSQAKTMVVSRAEQRWKELE